MTALLMILVAGLLVGRFARRITPPLEVLLFLLVAAIVLVQLVAWKGGMDLHMRDLLPGAARRIN
ncbi:MAG: hypothetical protein DME01_23820 [Candidatus Rokuibacteriota bacterium]|nr:MAG: hypothetical protein DME01_23820 [Candidatus Rokubacteria bacterium]